MAHLILMPQAGQSMTEGRVVAWLKKEGDDVRRGDPLLEIETDKANLEVEALESGVLRRILVPEGEVCPVLAPVGVIGDAGEEVDEEEIREARSKAEASSSSSSTSPPDEKASAPPKREDAGGGPGGGGAPVPRAESRAPDSRAPESTPGAPSPESAPPRSPTATATGLAASPGLAVPPGKDLRDSRGRRVLASPLARRIAADRKVDLRAVRGSGPGGRIVRADVEDFAAHVQANGRPQRGFPVPSLEAPYPPPSPRPPARVPFEGMREAIARALTRSKATIPHFTTTLSIDAGAALELKAERARDGHKVTLNDLVVRAVTLALRDEPRVNCRVFEDRIEYPEDINVGIAVGSDEGLVVPVLLRAQEKDLARVAEDSRRLVSLAREGKLQGAGQGTFTISNLGMLGIDHFTAIINPPEGAILAVGAVRETPVVAGGGFFARPILQVTLSADHRAIDGLLAARFLTRLRHFLELPRDL